MKHRYAARFVVMLVVGVAVGGIVAASGGGALSVVLGWAAASLVYVSWVWLLIARMGPEETASHALREDPVRRLAELLILVASLASLAAVAMLLVEARSSSDTRAGVLAAVALGSVALSWLLIHTLFTLRYTNQYFSGEPGGIDFNTDEPPCYIDFAYVAFSLGMTFQISDTNLLTSAFRATALKHALLSYVFGTVVVATTINLAVSLSS
ncbi:DUF1345 domain-containing protein [Aeromicrobium ginsengisoli]|uniref:DUF1345 domain-containing protein n=1 Tax=Aeromicrobium ginsengisoli TaxID=363867 RepID=A0A5M4FES6_9ACTN|nr:DUF1345 domain-containing protein [Aeromicrobium ginsengisoli]KAA1397855.1 DUF1345 domain-containing protein [Aeromicrobium ginsengisoli]